MCFVFKRSEFQNLPLEVCDFSPKIHWVPISSSSTFLVGFLLAGLKTSGVAGPWSLPQGSSGFSKNLKGTNKRNKPLGKKMSDSNMLAWSSLKMFFSGRCCYKTSLISSTGVLECWNAFRKDQLFTGKRNGKKRSRFLLASLLFAKSTCILCLDYMIMILLACEENNQLCFKGHSLISSDFAGFWHFSDFHPVARVSKRMMNYDDLFRCGETRPMHEVVQAANADVAKAFNGLRTSGGGWGMVGSNGSW